MNDARVGGPALFGRFVVIVLAALCACEQHPSGDTQAAAGSASVAPNAAAPSGSVVQLCDGETSAHLPPGTPDKTTGSAISAELMAQWKAKNPTREWDVDPDPPHAIVPGADNSGVVQTEANQGSQQTYGRYTSRDVLTWKREVERGVAEGDRVFHDATSLGSTIAVSCDMCHPNAANTHPETYPKYQVQLGRMALLRDMINWCLQHPVRAEAMTADDPRMRAMEAYIYAQRKGVTLDYGRK